MASYLQGVTDFIPQLQPFQPDLNFYGNVMQTKQTQYDNNWKSLNNMYSQYYNAELTREDTTNKKNNYLNQIEFNLKRVSQLDLSLEQNVNQATQIFKPFYQDKLLMKDMALTKNYNNQLNKSQILKNSSDVKDNEKYWDVGVREMQYKREEFKSASEEDALSFSDIEYTPYVNTMQKAKDLAKDLDVTVETPSYSTDKRFIIKTKNGEQVIEPLQKLFESMLSSDPYIQARYKTEAYVNRKDTAYANAAQFNGDVNAAEMKYLESSFNVLKDQNIARYTSLKEKSNAYSNKIADIKKQIANGTAFPDAEKYIKQYELNKDINDKILSRVENEQKELNIGQASIGSATNTFTNPYGDLKSLRSKVDSGMANILMVKDFDEAANAIAYTDYKQTFEVNPYAVLAEKNKYSMQQIAARNAGLQRAVALRNAGERQTKLEEAQIKNGTHYRDDETGELIRIEPFYNVTSTKKAKGNVTDQLDLRNFSKKVIKQQTEDFAIPYLKNTTALIDKLVGTGVMTEKEASQILSYSKYNNISRKTFSTKLNDYGDYMARNDIGSKDLKKIQQKMTQWLQENKQLSQLNSTDYDQYAKSSRIFNDYTNSLKVEENWYKESSKLAVNELKRKGYEYAEYLYDENGKERTKEEFFNALPKSEQKQYDTKEGIVRVQSSPLLMGTGGKELKVNSREKIYSKYNELKKAASVVYKSDKIKPSKLISTYGSLDEGSGAFSPTSSTILVNPKAHTQNNARFNEVLDDILNIDWGITNKNRVTFYGIGKSNYDNAKVNRSNNIGFELINRYNSELKSTDSKLKPFRFDVHPVAASSINKAAVTLYPDAEWLKQFVYKQDKDKNATSAGLISVDDYNAILKNGLSYITDASNMKNSMYKNAFKTPLQSYVDYLADTDETYVYSDDSDPRYKVSIKKNNLGTGDYTIKLDYLVPGLEGKTLEEASIIENTTTFGTNLENARDNLINLIPQYKQINRGR